MSKIGASASAQSPTYAFVQSRSPKLEYVSRQQAVDALPAHRVRLPENLVLNHMKCHPEDDQ